MALGHLTERVGKRIFSGIMHAKWGSFIFICHYTSTVALPPSCSPQYKKLYYISIRGYTFKYEPFLFRWSGWKIVLYIYLRPFFRLSPYIPCTFVSRYGQKYRDNYIIYKIWDSVQQNHLLGSFSPFSNFFIFR